MDEYIRRGAAIEQFEDSTSAIPEKLARIRIEEVPAADVVEVVHSKWDLVDNEQYAVCLSCECCIPMVWSDDEVHWNYCPNCGAKMDGGQDDGGKGLH